MDVLDRRLSKKPQPAGLVAKKVRKVGAPSDCEPPSDAPAWALIRDNGTYIILWRHAVFTMYIFLLIIGSNENNEMHGGGKLSE